jgi:curved DNA-binding protein CbpA
MPSGGRVSEEELGLFSSRIAVSLVERPVELAAPMHRERVAALLRQVGEGSLYDLLGVEMVSPALKVYEGYERTARLVHPDNAQRLDLVGREGVLEVLFERVTEAYLTLSNPERRKRYDREQPGALLPAPAAVPRADEAQRLYDRARGLAASEQLHAAIELLREAVRTTPKPDYLSLLGLLEAKNPRWLHHAEEHLRRAIALGAKDTVLPAALAEIRRRIEAGETTAPGAHAAENGSQDVEIL